MERIFVINPGATSTKIAVFDGDKPLLKKTVEHHGDELKEFKRIFDQKQYRMDLIVRTLSEERIALHSLNAIVGRGGLMKHLDSGTYKVNALMVDDLENQPQGEHASNLGAALAYDLSQKLAIPAFIVDPVSVDEMEQVARISGFPEIQRISMSHALNMKAVARKVASEMGKKYEDVTLVVAHLGTGISVSAHYGGRMIDTIDGKDEGPFAPDRCGGLPAYQLVKLCYSGKYTLQEMRDKLFGSGGLYGYLGTKDIRQVEQMADTGDEKAKLILQAFVYQVAKEIGAMSTVLYGAVDGIILTGGIAYSNRIVNDISQRVRSIAKVVVVPGEDEMESLASGALRVLRGEETAKIYQ
jgi:butyrate kinase